MVVQRWWYCTKLTDASSHFRDMCDIVWANVRIFIGEPGLLCVLANGYTSNNSQVSSIISTSTAIRLVQLPALYRESQPVWY